jgi:hypothetical protein
MSARVNRPTDVKVKEADVNRKLQIYGIFSGQLAIRGSRISILTIVSTQRSKRAKSLR